MNKADLIKHIVEVADVSQSEATKIYDTFISGIVNTLKSEEKVMLSGLGTLSVTKLAARKGRNPKTGEEIEIAARNKVKFSASKDLKDAVN